MNLEIKWIGSPYYGYPRGTKGRNGYKVIAIVNHIMAGTLVGTDAWFNDPDNGGVSAHFGVGKNGEIHQYVDINDVARHTGNVNKPSWTRLIAGVNPNYYTIGIEHEGHSGEIMPDAQYQATLALQRWLIETFDIEPGEETIIGHSMINSVVKGNCPGPTFPWEALLADLRQPAGPFSDVPSDHWAVDAVKRIAEAGIMGGYPDGTFKGDQNATRYELASTIDKLMTAIKEGKI